ncbi:hypothetical protein V7S43_014524 [Phytophthora oleae]|uniref:Uncharacterized protein n=1 Tax=Phytophthora oleae TaxID=2107226 RepID=A0ABD3F3Y1_9STRA
MPCIDSFGVPTGATLGIYSMVWYWEFWLEQGLVRGPVSSAKLLSCGLLDMCRSGCLGSSTTATELQATNVPETTTATTQTTTAPQSTISTALEAATETSTTTVPVTEAPSPTVAAEVWCRFEIYYFDFEVITCMINTIGCISRRKYEMVQ